MAAESDVHMKRCANARFQNGTFAHVGSLGPAAPNVLAQGRPNSLVKPTVRWEGDSAADMLEAGVLKGLARTLTNPQRFLYDLQKGPFERQNHHGDPAYASIEAQLATRLHQLQNCAGASCRTNP